MKTELSRIEPAWAECAAALASPDKSLLAALHAALERRRAQVQGGDTLQILQALLACCDAGLPAPAWLADAFRIQLMQFIGCSGTASSLDEVFRSPLLRPGHPKRTAADRAAWAVGLRLWEEVRLVAARHRSLEGALAEVLSTACWPVRKRRARELVLLVERVTQEQNNSGVRPLAHIFQKPCKRVTLLAKPAAMRSCTTPD